MQLNTKVTIKLNESETEAWNVLFDGLSKAAHTPCEDFDCAEAISNFYEAFLEFANYLED